MTKNLHMVHICAFIHEHTGNQGGYLREGGRLLTFPAYCCIREMVQKSFFSMHGLLSAEVSKLFDLQVQRQMTCNA